MTDDERAHAELLAIYQQTVEDIERAKQWGWQVMYLAVIAEFGALAIAQAGSVMVWEGVLFSILIWLIAATARVYIQHADASIERFRERLERCKKQMQPGSLQLLGQTPRDKPRWPLDRVVVASALSTLLLLWAGAIGG